MVVTKAGNDEDQETVRLKIIMAATEISMDSAVVASIQQGSC